MPDDAGECRSDKGRNGIISTGFGCAEGVLRTDIAEDAQSVCYKPQQERGSGCTQFRQRFADAQGNEKRAESGKDALEENNLEGAFVGDISGTVIFQIKRMGAAMSSRIMLMV